MDVVIRPDAEAAADLAARLVADRLRARPDLVLGLATGRTMERVYALLGNLHAGGTLGFAGATTFNLDEYLGLGADDPNSYRAYMRAHLFSRVDLRPDRTFLPDGLAADLQAEAARYEALIREAGGIDLQLLGIGETGHIGFNEPGSSLASRTRDKTLTPRTRAQNSAMFGGDPEAVPARAMTMGVGTILEARELVLVATGAAKADILARAVEGPLTASVTASAIQLHPRCTVITDEAAAARLAEADYYRWVFSQEPAWGPYRD